VLASPFLLNTSSIILEMYLKIKDKPSVPHICWVLGLNSSNNNFFYFMLFLKTSSQEAKAKEEEKLNWIFNPVEKFVIEMQRKKEKMLLRMNKFSSFSLLTRKKGNLQHKIKSFHHHDETQKFFQETNFKWEFFYSFCLNSSSSSNCGRKIVCFCRQKMELFLNVFVNFFSTCGFNLCFLMELRDSFVMSCASFMVVWTWPPLLPLWRDGAT